jgi:hypothetical protein
VTDIDAKQSGSIFAKSEVLGDTIPRRREKRLHGLYIYKHEDIYSTVYYFYFRWNEFRIDRNKKILRVGPGRIFLIEFIKIVSHEHTTVL